LAACCPVALIDEGHVHAFVGGRRDRLGHAIDPGSVIPPNRTRKAPVPDDAPICKRRNRIERRFRHLAAATIRPRWMSIPPGADNQ